MPDDLYTLVLPSGREGTQILVMTDIVVKGDEAYPCFRDVTYSQPLFLTKNDMDHLFGHSEGLIYNLWTIDNIDSITTHKD